MVGRSYQHGDEWGLSTNHQLPGLTRCLAEVSVSMITPTIWDCGRQKRLLLWYKPRRPQSDEEISDGPCFGCAFVRLLFCAVISG